MHHRSERIFSALEIESLLSALRQRNENLVAYCLKMRYARGDFRLMVLVHIGESNGHQTYPACKILDRTETIPTETWSHEYFPKTAPTAWVLPNQARRVIDSEVFHTWGHCSTGISYSIISEQFPQSAFEIAHFHFHVICISTYRRHVQQQELGLASAYGHVEDQPKFSESELNAKIREK